MGDIGQGLGRIAVFGGSRNSVKFPGVTEGGLSGYAQSPTDRSEAPPCDLEGLAHILDGGPPLEASVLLLPLLQVVVVAIESWPGILGMEPDRRLLKSSQAAREEEGGAWRNSVTRLLSAAWGATARGQPRVL
jgi:hypothetical protein